MTRPHLSIVPKSGEDAAVPEGTPLPIEGGLPLQGEMPFAVVQGEPLTQLPRDLYIPPQALEVFLEAFEGPFDTSDLAARWGTVDHRVLLTVGRLTDHDGDLGETGNL